MTIYTVLPKPKKLRGSQACRTFSVHVFLLFTVNINTSFFQFSIMCKEGRTYSVFANFYASCQSRLAGGTVFSSTWTFNSPSASFLCVFDLVNAIFVNE